MRQLRLIALPVESWAGESEFFGLMLCSVSVSQEPPSGSGPEEVGSRLCFCPFLGGGGTVLVLHSHLCGFSPFSKRYAVWSLTFQNNQIYLSFRFVSLPGRRHQFDPTEWPFPVFLIFLKHKRNKRDTITYWLFVFYSGGYDSWEVEVKWNNQRTDRGSPPPDPSCWVCLSPPPCFLTLSVLKQVLQLSVDEFAALVQHPQAHRGHPAASRGFHPFWWAVTSSLSKSFDINISSSFKISPLTADAWLTLLRWTSSESLAGLVFSNICPSHLCPSRLSHVSSGTPHLWLPSWGAAFDLLSRSIISTWAMLHIYLLFKALLIWSSFQLRARKDDWLLAHFSPLTALSPFTVPWNLYYFSDKTRRNFPSRNIRFKKD